MNRETQRQINRLNSLANYIEKNPTHYDQLDIHRCVVGLGARLVRGKLEPRNWGNYNDERIFAKRFGVSEQTADNIFCGRFGKVYPRLKNLKQGWGDKTTAKVRRSAVTLLRYMAKQKAAGKSV